MPEATGTTTQGSRLERELRRAQRSKAWLARQAGYSRGYVSRVCSGDLEPSSAFRHAAAVALGIRASVLFDGGAS